MKLRIHVAEIEDFSQEILSRLSELYTLTTGPVPDGDLPKVLEEVDIFWFRLGYNINDSVISQHTKCRVLVTPVTGIDHIDEDLCALHGIRILCLRGEEEFLREVRATAEHTILLTLMLLRQAVSAIAHTNDLSWNRDLFRGFEIYKKNVGILGMGRLGQIVASYYVALGAVVYYYDIQDVDVSEAYHRCGSAAEVVDLCQIISIHIPYNVDTHHIYGDAFFSRFTDEKWLINTARGGVIDESALLDALEQKTIAGAALDVLEDEPDVENNKLLDYGRSHDNLVVTPHIGGNTYESFEKTEKFLFSKLQDYLEA